MFICDKNFNCCDYIYWDGWESLPEEDKKEVASCGNLIEVAPLIHSHWEYFPDGGRYGNILECQNCGAMIHDRAPDNGAVFTNYCPNCGAKMDEQFKVEEK